MLMKKHQRAWRNYNIKKEGAVHLSRIDFNMSFKGRTCWYTRWFFHKLGAFQKLKILGSPVFGKGIYVVIQKLIFFCVYRQSEQSHC